MTTSSFKNHHRPYLQSTKHRLLHVVLKWCNLYMLHRKDSDRDNMEYRIKSDIIEKKITTQLYDHVTYIATPLVLSRL